MANPVLSPVFSRISADEKNNYDLFFSSTADSSIQGYGKGWRLDQLVSLAETVHELVVKMNPILQEGSPESTVIPGRQWELDQLSEIKQRLAKAVEYKRGYYETSWAGKITKYLLKCLGKWNNGDTAAIIRAEEFLIKYDSRLPVCKRADGYYEERCFFPFTSISWVRRSLNTNFFFNYNPRRTIPVVQNFRYDILSPSNPQIFIRV